MLPHCRARNLPQPLARYRLNPRGLVATNANRPRQRTHLIRETLWAKLGLAYDLYDDTAAAEVSEFLRGHDIAVERRAAAYGKILRVLRVFVGSPGVLACDADAAAARRLAGRLAARMSASPPADAHERRALRRLCRSTVMHVAFKAAVAKLANRLRRGPPAGRRV